MLQTKARAAFSTMNFFGMHVILEAFCAMRIISTRQQRGRKTIVGRDISSLHFQVSLSERNICHHHAEEFQNKRVEDNVHDCQNCRKRMTPTQIRILIEGLFRSPKGRSRCFEEK
jgi:hypothetical protein